VGVGGGAAPNPAVDEPNGFALGCACEPNALKPEPLVVALVVLLPNPVDPKPVDDPPKVVVGC